MVAADGQRGRLVAPPPPRDLARLAEHKVGGGGRRVNAAFAASEHKGVAHARERGVLGGRALHRQPAADLLLI